MRTFSSLSLFIPIFTVLNCQKLTNAFILSPSTFKFTSNEVKVSSTFKFNDRKCTVTTLSLNIGDENDAYNNDNAFDVEAARKRLESLVAFNGESSTKQEKNESNNRSMFSPTARLNVWSPIWRLFTGSDKEEYTDYVLPSAPLLSTIDRERKEAEIHLLGKLEHGDEALADLWELWFQERGQSAAARLHEADKLTNMGPQEWEKAEKTLLELITEYGVHWAEPSNRLATLYYMQGKMKASEAVCLVVLAVKPWHFGALSGLVMIHANLNDAENARLWASRRLPSFAPVGPNRRREQWVSLAVEQAKEKLRIAEDNLKNSFGLLDEHVENVNEQVKKFDIEEEEGWQ